ncbi:uncharacterized protein LOC116346287 [Contarinia nasturtii]|uniref:uncharacterized protein LOC116346287 n=1 Tax=Contarinia nasturtii TaxID=265458 RepID=UPI0012D3FA33|nr:uncharacterized protein LOC116346287 [Contarinia nasturtii]
MSKLHLILLISTCIVLLRADPGLLLRRKKGPIPIAKPAPEYVEKQVLVIEQQPPPPPPPCKTDRCKTCHNECNGNEKCHNECIVVDRCRTNCNGYEKCVNECGTHRDNYYENDRCHGCQIQCPNNRPLLRHCEPGKWLYYIQVPKSIVLSDFVSNPHLIELASDSNLELTADGITGRTCLNDKTRYDLNKLNAAMMPIPFSQK